jgi:hypothetical protein
MSTPANPPAEHQEKFGARLRNFTVGALFAIVLLVPRVLDLRRNEQSWLAFRVILGLVGAALVVLPLGLWNIYFLALGGLAIFLTAILLPPAKPSTTVDEKARELGAFIVVNGGSYQPGNEPASAVQLFVGPERIWALDSHLRPLLVLPTSEIIAASAEHPKSFWVLRIQWSDRAAEFSYRGVFAEHLARVAQTTLQSVIRPALPVIPQRRAASA